MKELEEVCALKNAMEMKIQEAQIENIELAERVAKLS